MGDRKVRKKGRKREARMKRRGYGDKDGKTQKR